MVTDMYDLFITRDKYLQIKRSPGIYIFLSDDKIPLYVGKSNNIRHRVRQHFSPSGNKTRHYQTGKFYFIAVIYHKIIETLDQKETEIISLLKPALNVSKVNYTKIIDISEINDFGKLIMPKCKFNKGLSDFCNIIATDTGYCHIHDPSYFHWIYNGKYITSEIQRLISEEKNKQNSHLYMSKSTFRKLISENTFAETELVNGKIVSKFKNNFIIIDEDEIIRLETMRKP